ncbi:MAG TPA: flavin reductase family protein [Candidatus Eisenbacteria bacterium]|nr:flavin reductase family protein [Candidatus Eisenbacteria bacterium]
MNEDARKKILRQIPYGLYVIGVKDGGDHHAFTGSWLSQCSMKPPRVMLGVRHGTQSLDMIRRGKVFTVNFLAKSDAKVFEQFFKPSPASGNRFGEIAFALKKTGAPVLDRSLAYLECEVREIVDAGDHSIVIGEVVEAEVVTDAPALVMADTPWHYGG